MSKLVAYHTYDANSSYNYSYLSTYLVQLLSVYKWQQYNGPIKLICNKHYLEILKYLELDTIYDDIILVEYRNYDKYYYWSAAKYLAHSIIAENSYVVMDMDAIYWEPFTLLEYDIVYIHKESPHYYPYVKLFNTPFFSKILEYPAINCGFLYFNNTQLKKDYYNITSSYTNNIINSCYTPVDHATIIEQKILGYLVFSNPAYKHTALIEEPDPSILNYNSPSKVITHVWGYKSVLKSDPAEELKFSKRVVDRIVKDYGSVFVIKLLKNYDKLAKVSIASKLLDC